MANSYYSGNAPEKWTNKKGRTFDSGTQGAEAAAEGSEKTSGAAANAKTEGPPDTVKNWPDPKPHRNDTFNKLKWPLIKTHVIRKGLD